MADSQIQPASVTKPIQLLAAWLLGLITIDGSFLGAANIITKPEWGAGALIIATIINVPIFLACLFLLQTRFRPEMQEDTYYSRYLERRSEQTGKIERIKIEEIIETPKSLPSSQLQRIHFHRTHSQFEETAISINDLIPKYQEIKESLLKFGSIFDEEFGSTSENPHVPKNLVLSFGENCEISDLQTAIRVCWDHGIRGIAETRRSINKSRIYIGAYGYDPGERPFKILDQHLVAKLLDPDLTEDELKKIVSEK